MGVLQHILRRQRTEC